MESKPGEPSTPPPTGLPPYEEIKEVVLSARPTETDSRRTETSPETTPSAASPVGIVNPGYNPYPTEPPPAYGPQTANFQAASALGAHRGALRAAAGTNQAILMNGRSSVAVVCPFCCNSVLTVTAESPSPVFVSSRRTAYYSLAGSILFIFLLFGIMMVTAGTIITLFVIPGFLIFLMFSTILVSQHRRRRAARELCPDVTHSCPLCNKTLGVSSGLQFLQLMERNQERY